MTGYSLILYPFKSQKPGAKFLKEYDLKTFYQAELSPNSPDSKSLDWYFWNKVKTKVYASRHNKFKDEWKKWMSKMMKRIKVMWNKCANKFCETEKPMKEFVPGLKESKHENG